MSDNEYEIDHRPFKRVRSAYGGSNDSHNIDPRILNWENSSDAMAEPIQDANVQGVGQWVQAGDYSPGEYYGGDEQAYNDLSNDTSLMDLNNVGSQFSDGLHETMQDYQATFANAQHVGSSYQHPQTAIPYYATPQPPLPSMIYTPPESMGNQNSREPEHHSHDARGTNQGRPSITLNTGTYIYGTPQADGYPTPSSSSSACPPIAREMAICTIQNQTPSRPHLPLEHSSLDSMIRSAPSLAVDIQQWTENNPNRTDQHLHPRRARQQRQRHHRRQASSQPDSGASYFCSSCGREFDHKADRNHHQRIHDEKTRVCSTCGKAFQFQKDLTRHEKTHSGARPYLCDVRDCEYHAKGFPRKDQLRRHMKTKHDGE